jgi:hypothetical protein
MKNLLLPTITAILSPKYRSAHIVSSECNELSLLTITSEERSAQYRGTFEVSSHVSPRVAPEWLPAKREGIRRTAMKWIVTARFAGR